MMTFMDSYRAMIEDYLTMFYDGWRDLMDNKSDPRTRDYPLMSSPFPTIAISLTYAYIVKVLGPKLMENRKPFELRKVLIVYNAAQVIFSAWLFYESCIGGWLNGYNLRCEPVNYSYSPKAIRQSSFVDWARFYVSNLFLAAKRQDIRKTAMATGSLMLITKKWMPKAGRLCGLNSVDSAV
ncbi:elongation of very long chain fatty acids protein isoform X4 [Drosophila santomea]|uniref:elongation of very long chain fatty acids protein isoform X4 n=1 Tax=Drosophila santomea TaxID=129105 RepID=UPI001953E480|nr:elongation of very long chain fatty acids protein isoform X4 [Drosophila santomea]